MYVCVFSPDLLHSQPFGVCLWPVINPVDEQEADILLELYRDIVEEGPDLFSMHDRTLDAPFR